MRRDEARVSTHELHDGHGLGTTRRLDPAIANDARCRLHGRIEAEGLVDEEHVVVDRLGHAHDAHVQLALACLLIQQMAGELRAVAADDEEHVDAVRSQGVADRARVEAAAPGLEDGAALHMNLTDELRVELDPLVLARIRQTVVARGHAEDLSHAVVTP